MYIKYTTILIVYDYNYCGHAYKSMITFSYQ